MIASHQTHFDIGMMRRKSSKALDQFRIDRMVVVNQIAKNNNLSRSCLFDCEAKRTENRCIDAGRYRYAGGAKGVVFSQMQIGNQQRLVIWKHRRRIATQQDVFSSKLNFD